MDTTSIHAKCDDVDGQGLLKKYNDLISSRNAFNVNIKNCVVNASNYFIENFVSLLSGIKVI